MSTVDTFSEIIDITLYRYNSIDLRLWGIVTRNYTSQVLNENQRLVAVPALREYLLANFKEDIERFNAVSDTTIHKEATSIYFIWQIFKSMPNLKYIRLNLNNNSSYNRIIHVDQVKTIRYDIKVVRGFLRMFDIFNQHELSVANSILQRAGILDPNESFKMLRVKDFLSALDLFLSENNATEIFNITGVFMNRLEGFEADNPEMLLITDRESDI